MKDEQLFSSIDTWDSASGNSCAKSLRLEPPQALGSLSRMFSLTSLCSLFLGSGCILPKVQGEGSDTSHGGSGSTGASSVSVADSGETTSASPLCNEGAAKPCNQDESGRDIVFPGDVVQGRCQLGQTVCEGGFWSACKGAVGPTVFDRCDIVNDDSNCNGAYNDGCECVQSHGPRHCGKSSLGQCRLGRQACINGWWDVCKGAVLPRAEVCDGQADEDCDGVLDSRDADCACVGDETQLCTIPEQKGNCALGVQTCLSGTWSTCVPRFKQGPESCAPPLKDSYGVATRDEDCDGLVDEYFEAPLPVGCEHYMIDDDGDGWGKLGLSVLEGKDAGTVTHGCFCELPEKYAKMGFVKAPSWSRVDTDCGDSGKHSGEFVHPGWHAWDYYGIASPALQGPHNPWKGGAFDYDCSGKEEREGGTRYLDCRFYASEGCVWGPANTFWKEGTPPPPCGETYDVPTCKMDPNDPSPSSCFVDNSDTSFTRTLCR